MQVNEVVTSFLKFEGKILILRRSESVSTYKGRWGGVSGFIEEGEEPVERATKEIKEETGLKKGDLELLGEGKSFSFGDEDEEINIKWIVHPFLFRTKTKKIKINREHFEFKWIRPEELVKYFTVPKLEKSLKRVL
ncbi:MAG: NUDIX pyrophosphatase [Candidatus Aenigmarchaeota archaeon]